MTNEQIITEIVKLKLIKPQTQELKQKIQKLQQSLANGNK